MSIILPIKNYKQKSISENDIQFAIKTILTWIGEDIDREGLQDTPKRLVKSYKELFSGYNTDPVSVLAKTFKNNENYQDFILLKDIKFISMCEHHMLPIIGMAHIAYIPNQKIVGISKLVRLVEVLSKRLQIQENLTVQIAEVIQKSLDAKGVGVSIEAEHLCMSARGVNKHNVTMTTSHYTNDFQNFNNFKENFLKQIQARNR